MEPQAYTFYRSCLESGRALHAAWQSNGAVSLEAKALLDALNEVIPQAVITAVMEVADLVDEDAPDPTPAEQALTATKAFGQHAKLRAALDAAAGDTYTSLVKEAPGLEWADLEWLAVAVAVGGVLSWVGTLTFAGAIVATLVARMLYALAVYKFITLKTEKGKFIVEEVANDIKNAAGNAAKSTGNLIWWTLAGVATVSLVGLGVYLYNVTQDDREKRRLRRELPA